MVDTLAISAALHALLMFTLVITGTGVSVIARSRAGLILVVAVGGALIF